MLKIYDIRHSIADLELIPKMQLLSKSVDGLFEKNDFCVRPDMFFIDGLVSLVSIIKYILSKLNEYLQKEESYPSQKPT